MIMERLCGAAIAGSVAALGVVSQIPAPDLGGDYSKYGVIGALIVVILALIYSHEKNYNRLADAHERNCNRIADEVKEASERQTNEIKAGNDKVATLLQSTLVQIFNERHGQS